ncbi:MAG: T9SS type A sorting domain-containing protein [Bacteroidota bacterium]|nr:T9SS type A sorting domain-containing protein [Bacteroidota bacterium]
MSVNITNGLTLTFDVSFTPPCTTVGSFTQLVCFTGIDNAADPCTTTVCVQFNWDCPLPVEISSFNSSVTGRNVMLEWKTITELNNARFEVERSVNNNWIKIGSIEGSGTTSSPKNYSYLERGLNSGTYSYRLKQVDINGNFEYYNLFKEVIIGIPNNFELAQNYPNPFNPSTRIEYSIPYEGKVRLTIYDAMGKEVSKLVDNNQTAGYYTVDFYASNLSSGIYYYQIEVSGQKNFADTKKMLLVK